MRRIFSTLSLTVMSLVLLTVPALAADETSAEAATQAFGQGQWDGMVLAAILGAIVGIGLFIDAYAGSKGEGSSDH